MAWWSTIKKCSFGKKKIAYLGHVISIQGVQPDKDKISAIQQRPTPTTSKELRGFLGLSGYYKRFIWNYGKIAAPLIEFLKKEKAFKWTEATAAAFQSLKQALMSAPVLRLPDFKQTFTIETDAYGGGIGAVLLQNGHPIAYISKAMGPKYKLLSAYEKEFYAILFVVKKMPALLMGTTFHHKDESKSSSALIIAASDYFEAKLGSTETYGLRFQHRI